MSKILEALRRHTPTETRAGEARAVDREIKIPSDGRELTQERLADIYFSAVGKPKTAEPPVIIKIVEKQRLAAVMPWIITSIAFLITAVTLFSTKRFFIDVRVIDDKTLMRTSEEDLAPEATKTAGSPESENFFGAEDVLPLEDFTFEGAAILQSSKDSRRLTLVNSSVAPFARAVFQSNRALDLSRSKLVFDSRGAKGGEKLAIALRDRGNIQAFKKGSLQPFPEGLTTEWKQAEILMVDVNDNFNPKNISTVRFEFGAKDTDNHSGDTIYVRNLRLVPLS